jgi:hypothetical protein
MEALLNELNEIRIKPLCSSYEQSIKISPSGADGSRFIIGTDRVEEGMKILKKHGYKVKSAPQNFDFLFVGAEKNLGTLKVYHQKSRLKNKSGELNIICRTYNSGSSHLTAPPKLYYTVLTDNPMKYVTYFIQSTNVVILLRPLLATYNAQRDYCLSTFADDKPYGFHVKLFGRLQIKHVHNTLMRLIQEVCAGNADLLSWNKYLQNIGEHFVTWVAVGLNSSINIYHKKLCDECKWV